DVALHSAGIPVSYELGIFKTQGLKLLKLHGSLNWGRCSKCGEVVPWMLSDFFSKRMFLTDTGPIRFSMKSMKDQLKHCGSAAVAGPAIVPPTWNKAQHHSEFARVWRSAADSLRDAENIFVSGYSLPETDFFFKHLYALGTIGQTRLKKFWVFNPS